MKQRSSNRYNSNVDKLGLSVLNRYWQEFCCQSFVWWLVTVISAFRALKKEENSRIYRVLEQPGL